MASRSYDWKRFWCPPDGSFRLDDEGYLYDPDSPYGDALNPNVVPYSSIAAKQCLVLLGEPGTGKSYELATAATRDLPEQVGDEVIFVNLRAFQTDALLYSGIFQCPEFIRWQGGNHKLHLFLDSLDECLLRIDSVTALLEQELAKLPLDHLILRIACRTADWRSSFGAALKGLFQTENVGVFELVPLRKCDVENAVISEGLPSTEFLNAVKMKRAQPFAIKPVTLHMLMGTFRTHGTLPATQTDLYEQGTRLLCEEPAESRRESSISDEYDTNAVLACASRIAAATVWGNKYAVWTDIDQDDVPPGDATIADLIGGNEPVGTQESPITQELVKATLGTGLFSSRGAHRMGWAHQTYAEFLAARYLIQNSTSCRNIMRLIVHQGDPQRRLPPQLHEAAAWVATMVPRVFRKILKRDPEVLLRSDVAAAEPSIRQLLVKRLLGRYDKETLIDRNLDLISHYSKLAHAGLAKQLRSYICGKKKGHIARRVAIDIAESCELKAVLPDLLAVTLDQAEEVAVRVNAAYAVVRLGDSQTKSHLESLAMSRAGADPSDDLKGCGLRAVWPEHMTARELFEVLTPPKRSVYGGSYAMFIFELRDSLLDQLNTRDLKFALEWIARGQAETFDFENIRENILICAWDHLDDTPELVEPFAKTALARLHNHHAIAKGTKDCPFSQLICQDHVKRRQVLSAAVALGASHAQVTSFGIWGTPLVTNDDLPWLAEQLSAANPDEQALWAKLMAWVFSPQCSGYLDIVLDICRRYPSVADAFPWLKPVVIDSPEGRKAKAMYLKHRRFEKRLAEQRDRPLRGPSPKERVLILLERFEGGDSAAWWQLNREMTFKPDSRDYDSNELEWNLMTLPVWNEADGQMRSRIARAAQQYVLNPPDMDSSWLGTNTLYRPACAGYRALALVFINDPTFVAELPETAWCTWAPIILAYPLYTDPNKKPHTKLISLAYQHAPDEVIRSLMTVIDGENDRHNHISVIGRIEHCWDGRLAKTLMTKVLSPEMKPDSLDSLINCLVRHGYEPAVDYVRTLITAPPPTEVRQRAIAMTAAEALLAYQPQAAWSHVWPAIQKDVKFGHDLFEKFAHLSRRDDVSQFAQHLPEEHIADLYLWLAGQYPHREDPHHEGAHSVGARENITDFRDGLLNHLKVRGTPAACRHIRRIADELSDQEWMKWVLIEAEENTRRKTWMPPAVKEIVRFTQDKRGQTLAGWCSFIGVWALLCTLSWLALGSATAGIVISLAAVPVGLLMGLLINKRRLQRYRWHIFFLILILFAGNIAFLLTDRPWQSDKRDIQPTTSSQPTSASSRR